MTATLQLSPLACWLIEVYQKYLSPRKGFCCAYRVRHRRRDSCSQFARRAIERLGVLPGFRLLRRRFDKCSHAKQVLDDQTPKAKDQKQASQGSSWTTGDCVSGCDPGVPVDACDAITSLANVAGNAGSGVTSIADAASCDGGCDVGGCDFSI
jgi:putative component of membrane protein insertase Oxa1/YidC/SpoIIIJ protein YidD